jgi:hypothetical protein
MLRKENIVAAAAIANIAAGRGVLLAPRGDTPLDILQHAMKPVMGSSDVVDEVYQASLDDLNGGFAVTPHHGELEALSDILAERLSKNISHIRNEINPLIRNIETLCLEAAAKIKADNPLNISLVHMFVPSIYGSAGLSNALEIYKSNTFVDPGMREQLLSSISEGMSPEQFLEMVESPDAMLNEETRAMVSTLVGREGYIPLWDKTPMFGKEMYCDFKTICSFLFLKAFNAGKHPSINPADLENDDRVYLSRLLAYFGKLTLNHIDVIAKDMVSNPNFLFLDPNNDRKVYVIDEKYSRWVDKGGSLEAVIGHMYNAKTSGLNIGDLINNPDKYAKIFERAEKINEGISRNMSSQEIERLVKAELLGYAVRNEQDTAQRTLHSQSIHAWFKDNRLYANESCRDFILRAVCDLFGKPYDAKLILTEMEAFLNKPENEAMSLNDAAVFAVTRMLGRWMAKMYHVERKVSNTNGGEEAIGPDNLVTPRF